MFKEKEARVLWVLEKGTFYKYREKDMQGLLVSAKIILKEGTVPRRNETELSLLDLK